MIERIIEYCARNPFIVILFVGAAAAWGWWSLTHVPLDAIPDLSDVQVIILTRWPGRSPDLVEDQITYPIVSRMIAAPKVKDVRGQSMFGFSFVYVLFEDGTDLYWARSRVLEYMSGVRDQLPADVTPTIGPDATGVGWVYEYMLVDRSGRHDLSDLRSFQDWYLKYWLESVDGVAEVASVGGFGKQYQVEVDPDRLLAYNLPLNKVIMAIRRSNNDVGGRSVEMAGREYLVRGEGYIKSVEDLEAVVVGASPMGTPITIRDIGRVQMGPDIRRGIAESNGEGEAVGGIVVMRYGENALRIIDRVKQKIDDVRASLPKGVELIPVYDRSELILASIHTLKRTLIEESIIVILVVIIFLLHFRSSLIAVITLPVAVIISFIPMYYMGLTSNIMSLGGIAIAIGAMVDAAVVLIENAHKKLEHAPPDADRRQVIIEAAKEVGKPLFFSLLIITISFMPVFTLEAQEGRLFKPLAFTKTFSMLFASLLSITLAPLLMVWFIRGRITPEEKHPISKRLQKYYGPWVKSLMRRRFLSITIAIVVVVSSVPVLRHLGSEFMPPLNEGSILYMPVTPPGISITEAGDLLHLQDKIIKAFPEVATVFGKIGRSSTATDPAPLSMVETQIVLKPRDEWRPGMTWDKLISDMEDALELPGVTKRGAMLMPIKTRIDMLTTGIRSPVGIKVYGPDLNTIQRIGEELEAILKDVPGTADAFGERVTGGYFIDFVPNREAAARYGAAVEDVQDVIETAIGGKNVSMAVQGRERYPISVRYPRELRDNLDALQRVLVPTPSGAQVPIVQLADIRISTGAPMIRDENAQLTGWVFAFLDEGYDIGGYVRSAQAAVRDRLQLPPGYTLKWAGQYEFMLRTRERLKLVIPLTLFIIIVMLYLNFRSMGQTLIVMLSVPFALTGSVWALHFYHFNISVAVWVGMIALAGLAAETGVVMLVYLDEAFNRYRREGRMNTQHDLFAAITEGAVQRVRPKLMTVMCILMGLVPIMWAHGAGADVMQRIALPMIGGVITSSILTLEIVPAIYSLWRQREITWVREEKHEAG